MDIYILRAGEETGPFDEKAVEAMLKQGEAAIGDLAWCEGQETWVPLHSVLYPPASASSIRRAHDPSLPIPSGLRRPSSVTRPATPAAEPASDGQKAFLSYMGVAFPAEVSREQASMLVNQTIERPKDARKLQQWNIDRLRLHPELFAEEIKERKENRAAHYHEVCQGEGAAHFENVTKAHAKVLVDYLDVTFPNWDENEEDAAHRYFFPAISEKFPGLVKKSARGKFKFAEGPKVARELARQHPKAVRAKAKGSPFGAMMRGFAYGLIILGLMFFGREYFKSRAVAEKNAKQGQNLANDPPAAPPGGKPAAGNAGKAPIAPVQPERTAGVEPRDTAAGAGPRMAPDPEAPPPASGNENPVANMNLFGEDAPASPASAAPAAPSAPGGMVMTVSNPFDPLALTAPVPLPPVRPATQEAKNADPDAAPVATPGRAMVRLTKPTMVPLRFGSSMLPAGKELELVGVDGDTVRVKFGPDVVSIPAENTDVNQPSGGQ